MSKTYRDLEGEKVDEAMYRHQAELEQQEKEDYVKHLRKIAKNQTPYTKGRILIIADRLEDGQIISVRDQNFLKWGF